jgi:glycosyltransferase involved in cell wall biosynthesis
MRAMAWDKMGEALGLKLQAVTPIKENAYCRIFRAATDDSRLIIKKYEGEETRLARLEVGTVHDYSSIQVKGKYDPARMFYITRVLPFLVRRLTQVLTVSESSKRDIVECAGVSEDKVTVTPLAADSLHYYSRDREEAALQVRERFGIASPYILFISRIEHPGKNHVRLIRAFSRLKQREGAPHLLVLAGSDWGGAKEVRRAAWESPFSKDIVFTGFAKKEVLPALYCGADLFVFPSLYEGFGLPVLEAVSCKVAVACSNISSMPEVAGDAAALFDPYDEESIEDALVRMLTSDEMRAEYGRRGLERSRHFAWSRTAALTLEVIRRAAKEGV